MKLNLEVEIDILPEELQDENNVASLIEQIQKIMPDQISVPFINEQISMHLMKVMIGTSEKGKNVNERNELIFKLESIHPAIVKDANPMMAWYVGGMKDDGGLNYSYLLKCDIIELKDCYAKCLEIQKTSEKTPEQKLYTETIRTELDGYVMDDIKKAMEGK